MKGLPTLRSTKYKPKETKKTPKRIQKKNDSREECIRLVTI